jgi:DNA polymerase-4
MLAERVAARLRRHEMKCTTVQVALRSPEFKTVSRQKRTEAPTHVSRELIRTAMELIEGCWSWTAPVRAITITAQGLLPEDQAGDQMDLFAPQASAKREKQEKLERTMDQIRERYGRDMIRFASRETDTAREIAGEGPRENKEETL